MLGAWKRARDATVATGLVESLGTEINGENVAVAIIGLVLAFGIFVIFFN